jgi:hypothetical protein
MAGRAKTGPTPPEGGVGGATLGGGSQMCRRYQVAGTW